ncbi:hypothetical protein [Amycolatopsis sp. CA-128772]|uniref:hypothetical protein n=1 Tax=Amycolatopsis sp. CA-128772 TaxID=2073159 RepID=UPI000CD205C9|nr:hypothetical protein [Amycolatopsis sp. CA-128772]
MTEINLYWTVRAYGELKAGPMVEAARNTSTAVLEVIRGWVDQLDAQAVLHTPTAITVHGDTATIRQPKPELTLGAGDWIVHASGRLLAVNDDAFRADFSTSPRAHA